MTKIDETTGLPELPEGFFWRIGGRCGEDVYRPWFDETLGRGAVRIMERVPAGEWSDWGERKYPIYWRQFGDEESRATTRVEKRGRLRKPVLVDAEEFRYRKPEIVFMVHESTEASDEVPVTSDNIVSKCSYVLKSWESEMETNRLYGDYPPKKLGDDS